MHRGWIKLHRKIKDNIFWDEKPFSKGQAWVDLLLIANHKDGVIKVKNGELITIKRGECGYSQKGLADKWGWSRGKVNRFLCFLNERKMVQQKIIENHTVTAILNYDSYQSGTTNDTTNSTTNGHQTVQQTDTNKNDNNDNNDKRKAFFPPSVEEVAEYCTSKGYSFKPAAFIAHYEVSNWYRGKTKIKSWKACAKTWGIREQDDTSSKSGKSGLDRLIEMENLREKEND